MRAERQGWTRLLDGTRAHWRLGKVIVRAGVRGNVVAQEVIDNFHRFAKPANQLGRSGKVETKDLMLGNIPASADSQLESAVRDVVDRHGFFGQQRRMAERIAADQDADPDRGRSRRQRREQRPTFEVRAGWSARLEVVIANPGAIVAKAFEELPALGERFVWRVLIGA